MSTVQENFDYKRTVKVNLASEKIRHTSGEDSPKSFVESLSHAHFARQLETRELHHLCRGTNENGGNQFLPSHEKQSRIERTFCDVAFRHSEREKYLHAR